MKYRFHDKEVWDIENAITNEEFCYEFFNAAAQDAVFTNTLYAYGFSFDYEELVDETTIYCYDEDEHWIMFTIYDDVANVRFVFDEIDGAYQFSYLEIVEEEEEED